MFLRRRDIRQSCPQRLDRIGRSLAVSLDECDLFE